MKMPKYNHAMSIAYVVISDDPEMPTLDEAWEGLQKRVADLEDDLGEREEALLSEYPWNTYELEDEDEDEAE